MRYADSNSATTSSIYEDTAGNIGINTNTPSEKLDVDGNAVVSGSLQVLSGIAVEGTTSIDYLDLGQAISSHATRTGTSGSEVTNGASNSEIFSIVASDFEAVFIEYVVYSFDRSKKRVGTLRLNWNSSQAVLDETSTADIGNTSGLTFSTAINGTDLELRVSNSVGETMYIGYEYKLLYIV
jgi:hypothetical protein